MEIARGFAYSLASYIGLGVLLLPFFVKAIGALPFLGAFVAMSTIFFLLNYIFLDLYEYHEDLLAAVSSRVPGLSFLYPFALFLFSVGALTAYILGFGIHATSVFGGYQQYWSTFFFLLAIVVILLGPSFMASFASISSIFLALVLLAIIPFGLAHAEKIPLMGDLKLLPPFLMVLFFAYFGQFATGEILKITGSREKAEKAITLAFLAVAAIYLAYSLALSGLSAGYEFSLTAVAKKIGGYLGIMSFVAAFLAFITPFLPITTTFVNTMRRWHIKRNSSLILLFFPVAVLYTAARQMELPLVHIAGGISGTGIAIFMFLAALAHYSLASEQNTRVPKEASLAIAIIVPLILLSYILPL